jgi:hypothetical protein
LWLMLIHVMRFVLRIPFATVNIIEQRSREFVNAYPERRQKRYFMIFHRASWKLERIHRAEFWTLRTISHSPTGPFGATRHDEHVVLHHVPNQQPCAIVRQNFLKLRSHPTQRRQQWETSRSHLRISRPVICLFISRMV